MKRTKQINQETFRKSWRNYRVAPVALAISAVFMLAGCEQADETVSLYQNADDCSHANPSMSEQCTTAYNNALKEAEKTAPKYANREDCVAEFGESQCTQAPAQAGMAAQSQSSGSFWMPLMAGYMMGRMMGGGYAQQPLFTSKNAASPANGKFVDASGKNYGAATAGGRTMTVPKTAMAPKPAVTNTITRGGFGETVAKQTSMQRSSSASSSSSRSMGG
ncbi:DUF1190 family protein [Serratia sp. DD3]|uniref:DUF1190 family protein n=1 Tax=Serratia sp. DD3 TaxID=1410619 RepID=UPI0003C501B9|nr:DUF1190 family protein [Serratia sp. DD3]KEY59625.1 hypothetical protein SRDD_14620 [Serratia sp. DD3]